MGLSQIAQLKSNNVRQQDPVRMETSGMPPTARKAQVNTRVRGITVQPELEEGDVRKFVVGNLT